jgi:outer membrane protein OmpA-like peptidoglycan-associated protein
MKLTLFLTLFILTSIYAKTADFSIIVHQPFNAALTDITEDYDRTLTAVGFSKDYKQNATSNNTTYTNAFDYLSSVSSQYGSQMHIIKVNNQADVLFSKQAKLSQFSEAVAVVKTPSNGYFLGGYTLDGSLIVLKLDANANLVYSNIYGTKNYDKMHNLILLNDGGVLAVGSSVTSRSQNDALFETGLGNNDIYITRFSKDGQKLWSKKYGTSYDDEGIDAVEAVDGSIIVLGTTSYDKHKDVSLMRINENGNRIWLKHYKGEKLTTPTKIIRLRDNNFVVSLIQYDDMRKEHIRLIKFDLYKNVLIDKDIFTTYPSGLNDIKEFSDGTFIGVGYVKDVANTDGLAMILDSNFAMLNQEHYGKDNYDLFNAVTILHNSQAAVAGIHTDNESQESNMWITKLNRDASMAQLSLHSSNFYEKLCELLQEEINSKQLTIREDLTIEFTDARLYFNVAEYKLTKTQEIFLDKFSKKLIPFLYANKDIIDTLEVNGHTSSEWGDAKFTSRYLNNEKLSMNRAYSTLSYMFLSQEQMTQIWLSDIFRGSGFSYAKNVVLNDVEDKKKSRRVSFKIILK